MEKTYFETTLLIVTILEFFLQPFSYDILDHIFSICSILFAFLNLMLY